MTTQRVLEILRRFGDVGLDVGIYRHHSTPHSPVRLGYNLEPHHRIVSHIEAAKPAKRSLHKDDICDLRTDTSLTGNLRFGGLEPLIEILSLECP